MTRDVLALGAILAGAMDDVRQTREAFEFPLASREVGLVTTVTTGRPAS